MSRRAGGDPATPLPTAPAPIRDAGESRDERVAVAARLADWAERYAIVAVWAIEIVIFSVVEPGTFLTTANFTIIFGSQAVLLILTLGLVLTLIVGEFDLSVAAMLGFSNQLLALLNGTHGWSPVLAVVCVLAVGAIFGCVNAFLTVHVGVPSIVATLGSGTLLTGLGQLISGNKILFGVSENLTSAVNTDVFGLPLVFYYAIAACVALWYVLQHTPIGRYLYFVGRNREVSRLAGLGVMRLRFGSMVAAALFATAAGILLTGQVGSASPETGATYLLPAFAAAFLGATGVIPGRFNVWGSFVAVYFLVTGFTGLEELGVDSWVQSVFYGGSLLVAVALARLAARRREIGG